VGGGGGGGGGRVGGEGGREGRDVGGFSLSIYWEGGKQRGNRCRR